jgi:hypothetical protein
LKVEAFGGDLAALFGGGGAAAVDLHVVPGGLLTEGNGEDAAEREEIGGLEVRALGSDGLEGHFLKEVLADLGMGNKFAILEVDELIAGEFLRRIPGKDALSPADN